MENNYDLFFSFLRKRLCSDGTQINEQTLTPERLKAVYGIAKAHDLQGIIADVVCDMQPHMPKPLSDAFSKAKMLAVYRYTQLNTEFLSLTAALERAKIRFLPLKGSVIRPYYPAPYLRTSCDIDVYVEPGDLEDVLLVLRDALSYKIGIRSSYDVSTHSPSGIHVEIHFALDENDEAVRGAFAGIMDRTVAKSGAEYHRLMSAEDFYAYHMIHAAKHFLHGGCGIRPFVDLYIMQAEMSPDRSRAGEVMRAAGVETFAENAERLCDVWLRGGEHTELTRQMADYIIGAGVYGTLENQVAIDGKRKGGRIKYLLGRVFASFDMLKLYYPRLEKYPILLPFYQVKRWCRLLFTKSSKRAFAEIKYNNSVSEQRREYLIAMCKNLDIL